MPTVVTFGELMLRLEAPGFERLLQSPSLNVSFGGAEANVAISLAHFGVGSRYVTRLPSNALGDGAVRALRAEGVDTRFIARGGDRLGLNFTETGIGQRPSTVLYDRAGSALSRISEQDVDWGAALADADWFHWSGITPALGDGVLRATEAALEAAREAGATISFDLNYRRALWSPDEARRVLTALMGPVDVLMANPGVVRDILGVEAQSPDPLPQVLCAELGLNRVALTQREDLSASENGWSATLFDAESQKLYESQRYVLPVVDRIGGGDAFAAGLIFALLDGRDAESALRFGVAAGALKLTVPGDFNRVRVDEVDSLLAGEDGGRVRR